MGPLNGVEGGEDGIEVDQNKRGVKRPGADHESDDESSAAPPENDIYRSRQQKRVHWKKKGGISSSSKPGEHNRCSLHFCHVLFWTWIERQRLSATKANPFKTSIFLIH